MIRAQSDGWRFRKVQLFAALTFGAAVVGYWLVTREPSYQDRSLTLWFEQLYQPKRGLQQAQRAVHEIGPEAVPFLLQKLREASRIKAENNLLLRLHRAAGSKLPPRLKRFFPEPKTWDDSIPLRVRWALRMIEPPAVPALIPALEELA